jgi:exodeoxyribonuclease VII small subunit
MTNSQNNESKPASDPQSFEDALQGLQKVISQLESGKLTLEASLQAFENGVRLSRFCQSYLNSAEKRVDVLMGNDEEGNPISKPFHSQND